MLNECLLQWMQAALIGQTFDGRDRPPLILHGESEAGKDTLPVHQHRARTARALITTLFRAGKIEMVAQQISNEVRVSNFTSTGFSLMTDCIERLRDLRESFNSS
jgi:hypothetical protein